MWKTSRSAVAHTQPLIMIRNGNDWKMDGRGSKVGSDDYINVSSPFSIEKQHLKKKLKSNRDQVWLKL
jgi:hypothetical protein